jgi:hypothetical protein
VVIASTSILVLDAIVAAVFARFIAAYCHPERSEGSSSPGREPSRNQMKIIRLADQDDKLTQPNVS